MKFFGSLNGVDDNGTSVDGNDDGDGSSGSSSVFIL